MSQYIPNTDDDLKSMLSSMGIGSLEDLIHDIPESIRLKRPLDIPRALSELELKRHFQDISRQNLGLQRKNWFLGGGSYRHFIPSTVDSLISRTEYYTAYTPYQPEISQGTLQAIFEYQTLICQLTGMDVSNASMYDGASSLAEAVLMGTRINKGKEIVLPRSLNPLYQQVIRTYTCNTGMGIKEIGFQDSGQLSLTELEKTISPETAVVVIQNPNFFGVVENFQRITEIVRSSKAVIIYAFSEALSLALLRPPGDVGADIVAGEGQSFGLPVSFGGPYLGIFATVNKYVRKIPGRLVGLTKDTNNNRGFVLTLSTREQHIRREKATSNICTNEGLCAITACIFLSTLGKQGLRKLAIQNVQKSGYAKKLLGSIPGCRIQFSGSTFNEFVVKFPVSSEELNRKLLEVNIVGGIPLECYYPELTNSILFCFTEMNTREEIEHLANVIRKTI